MALRPAAAWELELTVQAALDHHHDPAIPEPVATDRICDMHGILNDADRQLVRELVALRIALEEMGVAA